MDFVRESTLRLDTSIKCNKRMVAIFLPLLAKKSLASLVGRPKSNLSSSQIEKPQHGQPHVAQVRILNLDGPGLPGLSGSLGPGILDFPGWDLLEKLLSNAFSNLENVARCIEH